MHLTDAGTGTTYLYENSDSPALYVSSKNLNLVTATVSSVNTGTEEMTTSAAHGLTTGDAIAFPTAVGGLTAGTVYYASVVSSTVFKVCADYASAIASVLFVNLTAATTGTVIHAGVLNTSSVHGLSTASPVTVTVSGGTIITGLAVSTTYYARSVTANNFKLYTTAAAAAAATPDTEVKVTGTGTGTSRVHYRYEPGDLITNINSPQGFYSCVQSNPQDHTPGSSEDWWHQLNLDGVFEVAMPYLEADLRNVSFAQRGDSMVMCCGGYLPSVLTRIDFDRWSFLPIDFGPAIDTPTGLVGTPTAGITVEVSAVTSTTPAVLTTVGSHQLAPGEQVYIPSGTIGTLAVPNYYLVMTVPTVDTLTLQGVEVGTQVGSASTSISGNPKIRRASQSGELVNYYSITAVDEAGNESQGTAGLDVTNHLDTPGSYNTLSWTAVPGAVRYRIYRFANGLYCYHGQTSETSYRDSGDNVDASITLPNFDSVLSFYDFRTAAYYEGRLLLAGATQSPQEIVGSRSGSDAFSYSFPPTDDDRFRRQIDSMEAFTIRHLVPTSNLLVLTDVSEIRVSSSTGGPLTGADFTARPQTYWGANHVRPIVTGGSVLFCEARGGHVIELAYRADQGYQTGDLSIRAAHLFDGYQLVSASRQRVPKRVNWFVRSDGALLGLTYSPEEQVGGWHQHTTDGDFESTCSVTDTGQDSVFFVSKRSVDGTDRRMIEVLSNPGQADSSEWTYLDSFVTFDGADVPAVTMTATRATNWAAGSVVTLTTSGIAFRLGATDVGDVVILTIGGAAYWVRITAVSDAQTATATIVDAIPLATATTSTIATAWAWARNTIGGLAHLEGQDVEVMADGVYSTATVEGGEITLTASPARIVHVGRGYASLCQTLPTFWPAADGGQGRQKNVVNAWLRCHRSMPFQVAGGWNEPASDYDWAPVACDPDMVSDVVDVTQYGEWNADGQLLFRQTKPYPLTVVNLTTKVSVGS